MQRPRNEDIHERRQKVSSNWLGKDVQELLRVFSGLAYFSFGVAMLERKPGGGDTVQGGFLVSLISFWKILRFLWPRRKF